MPSLVLVLGSLLAGSGALAVPIQRQVGSADLTVVKFAALAEALESRFYTQALEKFTTTDFDQAGFDGQAIIDQITVIRDDESVHLSTLQSVATTLGGSTSDLDACVFNFDSALSTVGTFLATARVLEFVGVDAYIGGTTLIEDKGLLVSAAQIATVEARHNTVLNLLNGAKGVPSPFDMVLTPQQVLSVAAPFISGGCDPVTALGLTPTPALALTNTDPVLPGSTLTFGGAGLEGIDLTGLFCNMIVGGATEALSFPIGDCKVPDGFDGPVHVFIVNSDKPLSANIVTQDAGAIVAGPIVTFIDSVPDGLADLLSSPKNGEEGSGAQLDLSPLLASGPGKVVLVTEVTVIDSSAQPPAQ